MESILGSKLFEDFFVLTPDLKELEQKLKEKPGLTEVTL